MTGDELCDTFGEPEKLPGSFCEEETLPLLQPLGEQREEGGEGKRGAAKHRLLGRHNGIRNFGKGDEKEKKDDARSSQPQSHFPSDSLHSPTSPPHSSPSSPSLPSSPSSASNSLNVGSQPHFEHPSSSASVVIQQEECKQIPLSSSSSSSSSSSYSSSYMISNSSSCGCDCNCFCLISHTI